MEVIITRIMQKISKSAESFINDYARDANRRFEQRLINKKREEYNQRELKRIQEKKQIEAEIENNINIVFNEKYKSEDDLIQLYADIWIFYKYNLEVLITQLGLQNQIYRDKTDYGKNYFIKLIENAKSIFQHKYPELWVYNVSYNQNRRYAYLDYYYGGTIGVVNEIKKKLEKQCKKMSQILSELQISRKLLSLIMKEHNIKLPYMAYSPEGQQLKSVIERILEDIFHKYEHIIHHKLYYRIPNTGNFMNNGRKYYETDWLITIEGIQCIIELYTSKRGSKIKSAKEKIEFYKTLKDVKLIIFYGEDLCNEEYILQRIEQIMNVKIDRI